MSSSSNIQQSTADRFWFPSQAVSQWIHARVAAYQEAAHHRRQLNMLLDLRDRDPRLFEETGVDPNDLPPLNKSGVPFLAQTVVTSYFFGI